MFFEGFVMLATIESCSFSYPSIFSSSFSTAFTHFFTSFWYLAYSLTNSSSHFSMVLINSLQSMSLFFELFDMQFIIFSMSPAHCTWVYTKVETWDCYDDDLLTVDCLLLWAMMLSPNLFSSYKTLFWSLYIVINCVSLSYLRTLLIYLILSIVIYAALSKFFIILCCMGICFFKKASFTPIHSIIWTSVYFIFSFWTLSKTFFYISRFEFPNDFFTYSDLYSN